MVSLAFALSAPLGRNKHCTIAAFIVLGLVTYLGVIGRTSKQVQSPSSHPLIPYPLQGLLNYCAGIFILSFVTYLVYGLGKVYNVISFTYMPNQLSLLSYWKRTYRMIRLVFFQVKYITDYLK